MRTYLVIMFNDATKTDRLKARAWAISKASFRSERVQYDRNGLAGMGGGWGQRTTDLRRIFGRYYKTLGL